MTWSWSHTQEAPSSKETSKAAYDNVYYNISQLSLAVLVEIASEIKTYQTMIADRPGHTIDNRNDMWNESLYFSFITELISCNKEDLADFIYKFAAEQAECTNRGYEASSLHTERKNLCLPLWLSLCVF